MPWTSPLVTAGRFPLGILAAKNSSGLTSCKAHPSFHFQESSFVDETETEESESAQGESDSDQDVLETAPSPGTSKRQPRGRELPPRRVCLPIMRL
jgi:hypothetical protein